MSSLRLAIRVHGLIDGPLIWTARRVQKRSYHLAWPFWALSNRYENRQFRRMWDRAEKRK